MKIQVLRKALTLLFITVIALACSSKKQERRVLLFSKTTVYRHESIAAGIEAIKKLCGDHGIAIDTTENADRITEENLQRYSAVIFLNTTGDVLNQQQQNDFERFIQAGGGFLGIHAASDTEYDWPWYGKLVGAYFQSHPEVQEAEFYVTDHHHPASDSLPDRFKRTDELYNFKKISSDIKVLVKVNEASYKGGANGDDHPMAWYHEYDGGRSFYTAMGHTSETFKEPLFLKHLWGGLSYILGGNDPIELNFEKAHTKRVPEENRFTKIVLDEKLDEPVELAVLPDSRVLFIERKGAVKLYDPAAGKTKTIAKIPVSTKYVFKDGAQSEAEDGLLGLAIDPKFSNNSWIYLYYSAAGSEAVNILTRYEFKNDELVESSKKVILKVPVQREQCCHTGGSIAFDANGNLFLSTGDNSSPRATAYAPMDQREGRSPFDAQKGASNTNDLRGKILRIHPETDGSYTVPDGNLFPKGTTKTKPEIYAMGARNPYRISVDQKTGYLYWGDVGPDANSDSVGRGPKGFDEINQARKPGFFGWPYFIGNNQAYYQRDFASGKQGDKYDPAKPVNLSVNNTGLQELPAAQNAFIWYPYGASEDFPIVGSGGRTAMAGPVFYLDHYKSAKRAFPDYYDEKLFIYEWMRGWIMAVTLDKEGNFVSMERFMPSYKFSNPMDMEFGPEGDLYLLEYGTAWFQGNEDARLVKIEYNGGNRKPLIRVASDKSKGAVPLDVRFSSDGTKDYDRDELTYEWKIVGPDGHDMATIKEENTSFRFDQPGIYKSILTVTDSKGESSTSNLDILAGNEPPKVTVEIKGNRTFFFPGKAFEYTVNVTDKEDGTLDKGISEDQVSFTIDYLKEGFDKVEIAQGHLSADATAQFAGGKRLMEDNDCKACHQIDKKSIGPNYVDVAAKYKNDSKAVDYLAKKIINGGKGVWGDVTMAAHPQLSVTDANEIVKYILSLANTTVKKSLPVNGSYTVQIPKGVSDQGALILRASYTDKGSSGIPAASSEEVIMMRSATLDPFYSDVWDGVQKMTLPDPPMKFVFGTGNGGHVGYKQIDLTGIDQIVFVASAPLEYGFAGGTVEVRLDSPTGTMIAESPAIAATPPTKGPPQPTIVTTKLTPTSGTHDVYFIFRNPKAAAGQSTFVLSRIQFVFNPKAAIEPQASVK